MNLIRRTSIPYQHNLSAEQVFRHSPEEQLKGLDEVAYEIANLAHSHLSEARKLTETVLPAARVALLPAVRFL